MAEDISSKIKKEWLSEALGGVNLSMDEKVDEIDLEKELVILIKGTNLFSDPIFAYVKVSLKNFQSLREAMLRGDNFTPSDFGEVVAAGQGDPSQAVKDEMRVKYSMVDITREVESAAYAPKGFTQPKFFDDYDA